MAELITIYLGLGSNLGDRLAALSDALRALDAEPGMKLLICSAVYETEPWGVTDQPAFLNLVARFDTSLEPTALLAVCQRVERLVGRTETYHWGPRVIDIDILLYGDRVVELDDPDLRIPHARMAQRAFVLVPLAEIAATDVLPDLGEDVATLLQRVVGADGVNRWGEITAT